MNLSRRLKLIASWIDRSVIADIGCDHALLCIEAIQTKKAEKAYACDLRAKPLEQARRNILSQSLSDQIEVIQTSGLHNLPDDIEEIVICGMGGELMIDIFEADPPGIRVEKMILSSHKDTPQLRGWLTAHGWKIDRERVISDGHFYPVLEVTRTDEAQKLDEAELLYGFNVLADEDYAQFLDYEAKKLRRRYEQVPEELKEDLAKRIDILETLQNR